MPTTPQKRYPTNPLESMKNYIEKALQNREAFYRGVDEARSDFERGVSGSPYSTAPDADAAEQQFQNSPKAKEFIANNQWHMKQAIMFGVASMATSLFHISRDVYMMRKMMEDDRKASYSIPSQNRRG